MEILMTLAINFVLLVAVYMFCMLAFWLALMIVINMPAAFDYTCDAVKSASKVVIKTVGKTGRAIGEAYDSTADAIGSAYNSTTKAISDFFSSEEERVKVVDVEVVDAVPAN